MSAKPSILTKAFFLSAICLVLLAAPGAHASDNVTLMLFGRESFDRSASP